LKIIQIHFEKYRLKKRKNTGHRQSRNDRKKHQVRNKQYVTSVKIISKTTPPPSPSCQVKKKELNADNVALLY